MRKNLSSKYKVPIRRGGTFGDYYDFDRFDFKPPADALIVCKNEGGGLVPISVRLPHQVYVHEFGKVEGLTVIPIRPYEYIEVHETRATKRVRRTS